MNDIWIAVILEVLDPSAGTFGRSVPVVAFDSQAACSEFLIMKHWDHAIEETIETSAAGLDSYITTCEPAAWDRDATDPNDRGELTLAATSLPN